MFLSEILLYLSLLYALNSTISTLNIKLRAIARDLLVDVYFILNWYDTYIHTYVPYLFYIYDICGILIFYFSLPVAI